MTSNINFRVDDGLKAKSYAVLEQLGISPSELLRQTLEYVAQSGKLPFKPVLMNDEDLALLNKARKRLARPQPAVAVTLDDL